MTSTFSDPLITGITVDFSMYGFTNTFTVTSCTVYIPTASAISWPHATSVVDRLKAFRLSYLSTTGVDRGQYMYIFISWQ